VEDDAGETARLVAPVRYRDMDGGGTLRNEAKQAKGRLMGKSPDAFVTSRNKVGGIDAG
jgi:hypothetical protein